jgi:hypothetical protein
LFRVKLARETRDGRPLLGDFPNGAGGVWIQWDEVAFDPHLKNLSRGEVKEYCRIRQHQLDLGETPEEKVANETKAAFEAQRRVANGTALGIPARKGESDLASIAMKDSQPANPSTVANGRHPLPGLDYRAANRGSSGPDPADIQRANSIANREIARLEAAQARADRRAASRQPSLAPAASNIATAPMDLTNGVNGTNGTSGINGINGAGTILNDHQAQAPASRLSDNMARLNRVWEAQEATRIRAGAEDAKVHAGIKYQRKQTGPFKGKLVSQGTILTIDGEDYVEYRVLTKPSFF